MKGIKSRSMKLAFAAHNTYLPIAFEVEDLITLHACRSFAFLALANNKLGDRLVIYAVREHKKRIKEVAV